MLKNILTYQDELTILETIIAQKTLFDVKSLGRFAEPKLRRVEQLNREVYGPYGHSSELNQLIKELITSLFPSEISINQGLN